jgi:hypothetical protein
VENGVGKPAAPEKSAPNAGTGKRAWRYRIHLPGKRMTLKRRAYTMFILLIYKDVI